MRLKGLAARALREAIVAETAVVFADTYRMLNEVVLGQDLFTRFAVRLDFSQERLKLKFPVSAHGPGAGASHRGRRR